MKKIRFVFGAMVLMLSVASAFAFKSIPVADDPARVIQGVCTRVAANCDGDEIDCLETGTSNIVQQFQAGETCGAVLKMPRP